MSVASDGHGPLADLKAEDRSTLHQVCALATHVTGPSAHVSVLVLKHGNAFDDFKPRACHELPFVVPCKH